MQKYVPCLAFVTELTTLHLLYKYKKLFFLMMTAGDEADLPLKVVSRLGILTLRREKERLIGKCPDT